MNTERILQWCLLKEEYGFTLKYIKGIKDIVVDVLSLYPTNNTPDEPVQQDMQQLAAMFATANELPMDAFLLLFKILARFQQKDPDIQDLITNSKKYTRKTFCGGEQLV